MIVVDTNVVVSLLLPSPRTTAAERLFERDPEWAAPLLWRSEFANVLATLCRTGRLSNQDAARLMALAQRLLDGREYLPDPQEVLELAAAGGCSAYDAEFVALARALDLPFVTLDRALVSAFPEYAVSPQEVP